MSEGLFGRDGAVRSSALGDVVALALREAVVEEDDDRLSFNDPARSGLPYGLDGSWDEHELWVLTMIIIGRRLAFADGEGPGDHPVFESLASLTADGQPPSAEDCLEHYVMALAAVLVAARRDGLDPAQLFVEAWNLRHLMLGEVAEKLEGRNRGPGPGATVGEDASRFVEMEEFLEGQFGDRDAEE